MLLCGGRHYRTRDNRPAPGRVGNRHYDRRIAESDDDSAGSRVRQHQRKGFAGDGKIETSSLLLRLYERTEKSVERGIELHPGDVARRVPAWGFELHQG